MPTQRLLPLLCGLVIPFLALPAQAETCKPDQVWSHEHAAEQSSTVTDDIKGSPATRIEICRDEADSGAELVVTVQYAGEREARPLAHGACLDKYSKWSILRSKGTRNADGSAAKATGVYRICRD